jgi:hypothetical protein
LRRKSGKWSLHFNGAATSIAGTETPGVPANNSSIGTWIGGSAWYNGGVAELLTCEAALSDDVRIGAETYMAVKWRGI